MQHRIIEDQRGRNILMHLLRRSFPLTQLSPHIRIQFALDRPAPLVGIEYVEYQRIHTGIDHLCFTHMTPLCKQTCTISYLVVDRAVPGSSPFVFFLARYTCPAPCGCTPSGREVPGRRVQPPPTDHHHATPGREMRGSRAML